MAKLDIELFIARRMGSSSKKGGNGFGWGSGRGSGGVGGSGSGGTGGSGSGDSKGIMVRIATATVAIATCVMIVAVGVMEGFRTEISDKIASFTGHLRIQAFDYGGSFETSPITLDSALEGGVASLAGFRSMAPYAVKGGIIKTEDATQGVVLKGVGRGYDLSFFEESLREGVLPRIGSDSVRHKDLLVSTTVARLLRLAVDDRVEILFVGAEGPPRRDRFRVCGLYSSGLGETDNRFLLTDIANVQRLNGWDADQVSGYEITIDDVKRTEEFELEAYSVVIEHDSGFPPLTVRTAKSDYPQLFDWLSTHNVNTAVIISIMTIVALASMVSALLIILLERIRMIGILKALGMRSGSLRRIFILRSARILLWGLLLGNAIGIGLALLQAYTGWVKLDSEGYFLSAVPISLNVWWIAVLNVGTVAVILLLLLFPTNIIGRITPEKSIRYQ